VPEAAAGEQDGQIDVRVGVSAAHAGAVQYHRPIEQGFATLKGSGRATLTPARKRRRDTG
jgi:hypothetical protein